MKKRRELLRKRVRDLNVNVPVPSSAGRWPITFVDTTRNTDGHDRTTNDTD